MASLVTPGPMPEQSPVQTPTQETNDTTADTPTHTPPNETRDEDPQQTAGSASKIKFADDVMGIPLPKRLFTEVHTVAPTTHYTKLMDKTGRVPLSSRRGFIRMEAKDDLDGDSIDNAAATMVLMAKKYYPREYHDRQLVSANTMKRIIRDEAKKIPSTLSPEEGRKITHDTLRMATTHPTVLSPWWNDTQQQMSTQNNGANFWIAAISEYGSLFYHKQREIEQHTKAHPQPHIAQPRRKDIPLLRYDTPIEQVLEERAKAAAQAEARRIQGLHILELTLPPWHNTKELGIFGQEKYGVDLIKQAMDIMFTIEPLGWLHPLPTSRTHHPRSKRDTLPIKIQGEVDKYFQGFTPTDYGQVLQVKFSFQSKLTLGTLTQKFNDMARRRNKLYPHQIAKPRISSFDVIPVAWMYGSSYWTNRDTLQAALDLAPELVNQEFQLAYLKIKVSNQEPLDRANFTRTPPPGTNKAVCILGDRRMAKSLLATFRTIYGEDKKTGFPLH